MEDNELRKQLLHAKKTERIIFAATPELKSALESVAQEQCMSVSALITKAVLVELEKNRDTIERTVK